MKVGDKFFTIAYRSPKVIEVEIIETSTLNDIDYVHIMNVDDNLDRWMISVNQMNEWKFDTRENAEKELKLYRLWTVE